MHVAALCPKTEPKHAERVRNHLWANGQRCAIFENFVALSAPRSGHDCSTQTDNSCVVLAYFGRLCTDLTLSHHGWSLHAETPHRARRACAGNSWPRSTTMWSSCVSRGVSWKRAMQGRGKQPFDNSMRTWWLTIGDVRDSGPDAGDEADVGNSAPVPILAQITFTD